VKREHELKHLDAGPEPDESPSPASGIGIVRFDVHCSGNAADVLAKAKVVLQAVLSQSPVGWPPLDQWRAILPEWFVKGCAPEETKEEAQRHLKWLRTLPWDERARISEEERWSLANWLYWFEPKQRYWYWWDAMVATPALIRVAVEVTEWPFPWDALKWLFRACGAESVTAEE
jgi:hypothetical protein